MPRRHVPPPPDPVDQASQESFPASDPPAFTPVTGPAVDSEKSEGDQEPESANDSPSGRRETR